MARYEFNLRIVGFGDTPEEAWSDAIDGFSLDPGPTPEGKNVELMEDEDEF